VSTYIQFKDSKPNEKHKPHRHNIESANMLPCKGQPGNVDSMTVTPSPKIVVRSTLDRPARLWKWMWKNTTNISALNNLTVAQQSFNRKHHIQLQDIKFLLHQILLYGLHHQEGEWDFH